MTGAIYADSGYTDLKELDARSKSQGLPKGLTAFIAAAEVAGALGLVLGALQQLAAIGLIIIMLGAIQKKAFVWKTGFWGTERHTGLVLRLDPGLDAARNCVLGWWAFRAATVGRRAKAFRPALGGSLRANPRPRDRLTGGRRPLGYSTLPSRARGVFPFWRSRTASMRTRRTRVIPASL